MAFGCPNLHKTLAFTEQHYSVQIFTLNFTQLVNKYEKGV